MNFTLLPIAPVEYKWNNITDQTEAVMANWYGGLSDWVNHEDTTKFLAI